jgi:hypothetical protein
MILSATSIQKHLKHSHIVSGTLELQACNMQKSEKNGKSIGEEHISLIPAATPCSSDFSTAVGRPTPSNSVYTNVRMICKNLYKYVSVSKIIPAIDFKCSLQLIGLLLYSNKILARVCLDVGIQRRHNDEIKKTTAGSTTPARWSRPAQGLSR